MTPRISIAGELYSDFSQHIAITLPVLERAVNDSRYLTYRDDAIPKPSDIEVTPCAFNGESFFVVRSWHAMSKELAVHIQPHDFSVRIDTDTTIPFLVSDAGHDYRLDTSQTELFQTIGKRAIDKAEYYLPEHIYLGES